MKHLLILFLIFLPANFLVAETEYSTDIDSRYINEITYKINDDYTHEQTVKWETEILKERALEKKKKGYISYSASIQKIEDIKAYTLKKDGTKIEVPKTNYQYETNTGKDSNSPIFSDRSLITILYPEVDVGDKVILSYKTVQTEPMFPNQFSTLYYFPKYYAYDDVNVIFDYPSSINAKYKIREMDQTLESKNGRNILRLKHRNKNPLKPRINYTAWSPEEEPGYVFSTYESYEQIADAYAERALPKAVVTKKVKDLANEITANTNDPKEQTKLLYNWVAKNLTYSGNCIGVGAVVPRDLDVVIDNKIGDCKDHATLLQALLAAKGIKSTQALVNSSTVYELPEVPAVESVNHVMNYLPEMDLYIDATSKTIPFGMLPQTVIGKQVILTEGKQRILRIPINSPEINQYIQDSYVKINPDGSAEGSVMFEMSGDYANFTKSFFQYITSEMEDQLIKQLFNAQGYIGSGTIQKDDPKSLDPQFTYKINFKIDNFIQIDGPGTIDLNSLFTYGDSALGIAVKSYTVDGVDYNVRCTNGIITEKYIFKLPKNIEIIAIPKNSKVDEAHVNYQSNYNNENNKLIINRALNDRTPVVVCTPELMNKQREAGLKINRDLNSKILYKNKE